MVWHTTCGVPERHVMHAADAVLSLAPRSIVEVRVYYVGYLDALGLWLRSNPLLNLRQTWLQYRFRRAGTAASTSRVGSRPLPAS
jgi:hypothetical protein